MSRQRCSPPDPLVVSLQTCSRATRSNLDWTTLVTNSARPTIREAQKALTRDRLIAAATELFVDRGYAATTVDDIATGAGTTRATFYAHFRGKADLMKELSLKLSRDAHDVYQPLIHAVAAGNRKLIHDWLELAFQFWELIRPYSVAYFEAAVVEAEIREDRSIAFREGVDAIVAGLLDSGHWDEAESRARALLAHSQLESLHSHWLHAGWDVDRDLALDVMTDMWMAAFVPRAEPGT
jgi:AcrR family transcriptional regulator